MLAWWAWRETTKRIYLAGFYACMAMGTLAKGPVAPVLAAVVILLLAAAFRDWRSILRTLWFPGILLFLVIALPWYIAVQMANPQFFREFILEHNLARFSSNLYHHPEPFWYYIPVTSIALLPWFVFVAAAFWESLRAWWKERKLGRPKSDMDLQFRVFLCCWLFVPMIFFSISQSKLPGYILPAVPAGAILLADYLLRHIEYETHVPKVLAIIHALVASAPIVPAVLVGYLVSEHRLPTGRPMLIALAVAFVLCAAIALTLVSRARLRMLRFVTLIPVVLAVAAVLKMGTVAIDQKLSTRPLAVELASIETQRLPIAICGASREVEYGLAFYRDQIVSRYEAGNVPPGEHLLVALPSWKSNVTEWTKGRRITSLGHYAPQNLDYYRVASAAVK
jgi:4-amino-4-deoxy-L-arabinose transferase-like glycosyltransferase